MTALRWTLGLVMAIAAAGLLAIAIIAGGFRKSFGAFSNGPPVEPIILVVAGLVLASLVWPDRRVLMHIVAVLMVALCVGCAFLAREELFTPALGILYAVGWLTFYYRSVWAAATP